MKKSFADRFNSCDVVVRFENLPQRIFLDTNVLQYLNDFGEWIFEHYRKSNDHFTDSTGRKITKQSSLYHQIVALHDIFLGLERTNLEFALSESVYQEVIRKKEEQGYPDASFLQWFYDVWDYWQAVLSSYKDEPISAEAEKRFQKATNDKGLLGGLSKEDQSIVLDAIRLDCDALLTVDKFAEPNKQEFVFRKYGLMILKPTELIDMLKPFQALYY